MTADSGSLRFLLGLLHSEVQYFMRPEATPVKSLTVELFDAGHDEEQCGSFTILDALGGLEQLATEPVPTEALPTMRTLSTIRRH